MPSGNVSPIGRLRFCVLCTVRLEHVYQMQNSRVYSPPYLLDYNCPDALKHGQTARLENAAATGRGRMSEKVDSAQETLVFEVKISVGTSSELGSGRYARRWRSHAMFKQQYQREATPQGRHECPCHGK